MKSFLIRKWGCAYIDENARTIILWWFDLLQILHAAHIFQLLLCVYYSFLHFNYVIRSFKYQNYCSIFLSLHKRVHSTINVLVFKRPFRITEYVCSASVFHHVLTYLAIWVAVQRLEMITNYNESLFCTIPNDAM